MERDPINPVLAFWGKLVHLYSYLAFFGTIRAIINCKVKLVSRGFLALFYVTSSFCPTYATLVQLLVAMPSKNELILHYVWYNIPTQSECEV